MTDIETTCPHCSHPFTIVVTDSALEKAAASIAARRSVMKRWAKTTKKERKEYSKNMHDAKALKKSKSAVK